MLLMKKVFHFDSPREQYQADAAVVWCFDHRFEVAFSKFLKRSGLLTTDSIRIAGGAKALASAAGSRDREFVLDEIRKSVRLHATKRVILMVHSDCGAYGGLTGAFGGDTRAEALHHQGELQRAAANLLAALPGIDVQGCFVDFEGVWDVDLTPANEPPAATGNTPGSPAAQ